MEVHQTQCPEKNDASDVDSITHMGYKDAASRFKGVTHNNAVTISLNQAIHVLRILHSFLYSEERRHYSCFLVPQKRVPDLRVSHQRELA